MKSLLVIRRVSRSVLYVAYSVARRTLCLVQFSFGLHLRISPVTLPTVSFTAPFTLSAAPLMCSLSMVHTCDGCDVWKRRALRTVPERLVPFRVAAGGVRAPEFPSSRLAHRLYQRARRPQAGEGARRRPRVCRLLARAAYLGCGQQCASSPWRTWRTRTNIHKTVVLQICALVRPWAGDSRDTERYPAPPHDPG